MRLTAGDSQPFLDMLRHWHSRLVNNGGFMGRLLYWHCKSRALSTWEARQRSACYIAIASQGRQDKKRRISLPPPGQEHRMSDTLSQGPAVCRLR